MTPSDTRAVTPVGRAESPRRRIEASLDALLLERSRRRQSPKSVEGLISIEERMASLNAFLATQLDEPFKVSNLRRMSGGGANESYRFVLTRGSKVDDLVLRVKALGACCETDVPREFQIMRAVHGVVPIATPYWMTADTRYFGAPSFICSFVGGVQAPPSESARATGMGLVYGEDLRKQLAPQFVEYEARLHSFDWRGQDLSHFDIPRAGTTDSIDWRLAFWDRVWDEDKYEEHPTMLLTREWLWDNRPVADHISILHGDYRNGNFLYDAEQGKISGILDWELCSLGDRHCDLGYTMLTAWGHIGPEGKFLNSGLMDTESFVELYEKVSGLTVDPVRLHYYLVFNIYWSAVALIATAVRNADAALTQLDVMYNVIAGKGGFDIGELNRLVVGRQS